MSDALQASRDLSLVSDSEGVGLGDIVFKAGKGATGVELARITRAGVATGALATAAAGAAPFVSALTAGIKPANTAAQNKTALDAVMAGALAAGGTLLCDWDGTVLVDCSAASVTVPTGVTIAGRGWTTILKMTPDPIPGTMTSTSLKLLATSGDIVVKDIALQGAQVNAADAITNVGSANTSIGVVINAGRARLFNVKIFQFSFQVWTATTQASLEAYGCDFAGWQGAQKATGILDNAGGYLIVSGCHFYDLGLGSAAGGANSNQFHGIYTAESSNLYVTNSRFTSMYGTGYCVQVFGDVRGNRYSIIQDCYFERQPSPQLLIAAAVGGGGTFAANTYFWKVSAIVGGVETAGSVEATAAIALNGSCTLTWQGVPGATGYKVYRSTVTGVYTTPALVATLGNVVTYTDTGTAVGAGAVAQGDNIRGVYTNQFTQMLIADCVFDMRNLAIQLGGGRCKVSRCKFGGDGTVTSNNFQIFASAPPTLYEIQDCMFEGNNSFDIFVDQASGQWVFDRNIFKASLQAIQISSSVNAGAVFKIIRNRFLAQSTRAIEMDGIGAGTAAKVTIADNTFNTVTGECIRTTPNTVPIAALYVYNNDFSMVSGTTPVLLSQTPAIFDHNGNYGSVGYAPHVVRPDEWDIGASKPLAVTMQRTHAQQPVAQNAITALTSLHGGIILPAGKAITNINAFCAAIGAGAVTLSWFAIVRQSDRAVIGVTANSTALPALGVYTRALAAVLEVDVDTPVWIAWAEQVATTSPSFAGSVAVNALVQPFILQAPILAGDSPTVPTSTPPPVSTVLGAPTVGNAQRIYFWLT